MKRSFELSKVGRGKRRDVQIDGTITIGRSSQNELVLRHEKVSRAHCVVELNGDAVVVRDLKSTGGTWVNKQRIRERSLIHGDRVRIGPYVLRYVVLGEGEADEATSVGRGREPANGVAVRADNPRSLARPAVVSTGPPKNRPHDDAGPSSDIEDRDQLAAALALRTREAGEARAAAESAVSECAELRDQISHLTRDHAREAAQWRLKIDETTQRLGQLDAAKRDAEEQAIKWQERASLSQAQLEQTKQQLDAAGHSATAVRSDHDVLQARLTGLENQEKEHIREIQALAENLEKQSRRADSSQQEVAALTARLDAAEHQRESLSRERAALTTRLSELEQRTEEDAQHKRRQTESQDRLTEEAAALRRDLEAAQTECGELTAERDRLARQFAAAETEQSDSRSAPQREEATYAAQVEQLQKRIASLSHDLLAARADVDDYRVKWQASRSTSDQVETQIQQLVNVRNDLEARNEALSAEHEALKVALERKRAEQAQKLNEAQAAGAAQSARNGELATQVKTMTRERSALEKKLDELCARADHASEAMASLTVERDAALAQEAAAKKALEHECAAHAASVKRLASAHRELEVARQAVAESAGETLAPKPAVTPAAARLTGGPRAHPPGRRLPVYPEDRDYLKWIAIGATVLIVAALGVVGVGHLLGS